MPKIVPIVEGEGDLQAVPILLMKILHAMNRYDFFIAPPRSAHSRSNLTRPDGLEKFLRHAGMEPNCAGILILVDADKDCPKELAHQFAERIQALGIRFPTVIVVANGEYETWFLASLNTIAGNDLATGPGLPQGLRYENEVEGTRGAKGWLTEHFPKGRPYKEVTDQPAMTRLLDVELVREHSRSFRRLCHAVEQIVEAIDSGSIVVTP